jgi:hypothetical protein
MSKLKMMLIGFGALVLAGCGLTLAEVAAQIAALVADPAKGCAVVISTEQLIKALTGLDPNQINVISFVNSICSQVTAAEQKPTASPTTGPACYTVVVMGKPVQACKSS